MTFEVAIILAPVHISWRLESQWEESEGKHEICSTPEWKKAYIDYRGLKKRIGAIRRAHQTGVEEGTSDESQEDPVLPEEEDPEDVPEDTNVRNYGSTGTTPPMASSTSIALPRPPPLPFIHGERHLQGGPGQTQTQPMSIPSQAVNKPSAIRRKTDTQRSHVSVVSSTAAHPAEQGEPRESSGFLSNLRRRRSWYARGLQSAMQRDLSLTSILPTLPPIQQKFFDALDKELDKVETFYRKKEHESLLKSATLKEQLRELKDHRRIFHEAHVETKWGPIPIPRVVVDHLNIAAKAPIAQSSRQPATETHSDSQSPNTDRTERNEDTTSLKVKLTKVSRNIRSRDSSPDSSLRLAAQHYDPEEYKHAKKNLKKAVLEYYRGLELLNNYRVLNITGFRKAIKKFDKVARTHTQDAYMREKVEQSSFSSGDVVEQLLKEVESLYAARFESGDLKKARTRLRATMEHKSHHFSAFRTGVFIGLAIPAFISGLIESFKPETRAAIPWNSLLTIYGAFLIPVLFSLFVGTNILVWSRARINYGFIFDLDVRTQLDSRIYFELPTFLLCTLCYAFWLSFHRIGESRVASTTWPMAWLVLALVIMFNPTPLFFPSSRWWLIRKISKLFISGLRPVEFTDFWMGDQLCSLGFSLSNLYFVGCVYDEGWENAQSNCSTSNRWAIPFILTALPIMARAVQSLKRYEDSKLITHLINAGKYVVNSLYYALLFYWRHLGMPHDGILAVFCIFASFYSIYTSAWDILMDWSLFKHPAQHRFLRPTLIYSNYYYMYYFAIITNIIIRFIWVIYIPVKGPSITVRTFIAGLLEMLRRWQWNFLRLENEHIGNTDQYRATREIPLPYSVHDSQDDGSDDGGDEDDNEQFNDNSSWRQRRRVPMSTFSQVERRDNGSSYPGLMA